jgi:hypothetical protein
LEAQLQQQLQHIPTDTLASGLWAMSRLQLQPSSDTIAAVAAHLQQTPAQQSAGAEGVRNNSSSSSSNVGRSDRGAYSSSSSRLALCSARTFGGLCYSLNFFMLRDFGFWAAAAAAGRQHLAELKPAGISNLLQGLAASGWLVDPVPAVQQQQQQQQQQQPGVQALATTALHSDNSAGTRTSSSSTSAGASRPEAPGVASGVAREQQAAVTSLLQAVEQLLLVQPQQLQRWRMRDISQMCQAYALMGFNCSSLFAVVANHLLDFGPGSSSSSSSLAAPNGSTDRGTSSVSYPSGYPGLAQQLHKPQPQQQQQQQWSMQASILTAASSSNGYSSNSSGSQFYASSRGPRRLADCRPSDAAGLVWAYVAAFCSHKLLLQELAPVIAACAGQLHAADCCRLLWAYSTAGVADSRMLAAVTAATAEEMHGVLPRTAAGAVWSLAQMRYEAPAFMEAALDRLAVCLEATPVDTPGSSNSSSNSSSSATSASRNPQRAGSKGLAAAAPAGTAAAGVGSSSSGAVDRPSVLQQLLQGSPAVLLSGGPEARSTPAGELSMLGMMHRRRRIRSSSQQQQQQQQQVQPLDGHPEQQQQQQQYAAGGGSGRGASAGALDDTAGYDVYSDDLMLQEEQQRWQQLSDLDEQQQQQQQQQRVRVPYMAGEPVHCSHRDVAQAVYACGRLQHYNGAFFRVLRGKLPGLLPGFSDVQLVEVLWGLAQLNLYDGANMEAAAAEVSEHE